MFYSHTISTHQWVCKTLPVCVSVFTRKHAATTHQLTNLSVDYTPQRAISSPSRLDRYRGTWRKKLFYEVIE